MTSTHVMTSISIYSNIENKFSTASATSTLKINKNTIIACFWTRKLVSGKIATCFYNSNSFFVSKMALYSLEICIFSSMFPNISSYSEVESLFRTEHFKINVEHERRCESD